MAKDPKTIPRSHVQQDVIKLLAKNKIMTFGQIQEKIGISRPGLSRHLAVLLQEESIEYTKHGREKHYALGKNATEIFERKTELVSQNWITYAEKILNSSKDEDDEELEPQEYYEKIISMIGTYFLFTLFKGFETGDNWFKGFHKDGLGIYVADAFGKNIIKDFEDTDLPYYLTESFDKFFKETNKMLNKKSKKIIKTWLENLEHMQGQHFKILRESIKTKQLF